MAQGPLELGSTASRSAVLLDGSLEHVSACSLINKQGHEEDAEKQDLEATELHGEVTENHMKFKATEVGAKVTESKIVAEAPEAHAEVTEMIVDVEPAEVDLVVAGKQVDEEATKVDVEDNELQVDVVATQVRGEVNEMREEYEATEMDVEDTEKPVDVKADVNAVVTEKKVDMEATDLEKLVDVKADVNAVVTEKKVDMEATEVQRDMSGKQVEVESVEVHLEVTEEQMNIGAIEMQAESFEKQAEAETVEVYVGTIEKPAKTEATKVQKQIPEKHVEVEVVEVHAKVSKKQMDIEATSAWKEIPEMQVGVEAVGVQVEVTKKQMDSEVQKAISEMQVEAESTEVHTTVTEKNVHSDVTEVPVSTRRRIVPVECTTSKSQEIEGKLSGLTVDASKQVHVGVTEKQPEVEVELHSAVTGRPVEAESIEVSNAIVRKIAAVTEVTSQTQEAEAKLPEPPLPPRKPEDHLSILPEKDHGLTGQMEDNDRVGCGGPIGPAFNDSVQNDITGLVVDLKATTAPVPVLEPGIVFQDSANPYEADGESGGEELDSSTDDETSESHGLVFSESDEEDAGDSSCGMGEVVLKDEDVQALVDQLYQIESEAAEAQELLEEESLSVLREEMRTEFAETLSGSALDDAVEEELNTYIEMWEEKGDDLQEQSSILQDKLEDAGVSLPDVFKQIEKQAPECCSTEAWKKRTHWAGREPTQEAEFLVKGADEELKVLRPTRSKRGKLVEKGASGFLERKLADNGAASTSKFDSPSDGGWSKVETFLDNEETPGPGNLIGTKQWATVYLASTPEQAAQLGLALPGVDTVEEIGDMESERRSLFKAAFADEKERELTARQKISIKKVREEDDVKRSKQVPKRPWKSFTNQRRVKNPFQGSQSRLARTSDMSLQEKPVKQSHRVIINGESGKGTPKWVTGIVADMIDLLSDDEGAQESASRNRLDHAQETDANVVGVKSSKAPSESGEKRSRNSELVGDLIQHDVSVLARSEATGSETVQHIDVKGQLVCAAHVKIEHSDSGRPVNATTRQNCPENLEEMPPVPELPPVLELKELNDLKKKRAHEDVWLPGDGVDEITPKRSKFDIVGDEGRLSDGDQKEVQHSLVQTLPVSGPLSNDGKQPNTPIATTQFRTTVVIDSDGEREVQEAVTETMRFNNSTPKSNRSENAKNLGQEGKGNGNGRSVKNNLYNADHPDYLLDGGENDGQGTSKTYSSSDAKKRKWKESKDFPCTACGTLLKKKDVMRHPILAVGICKKCRRHYLSGPFLKDEDGSDSECSWCGEGGEVVCCGQCDRVFCQACITRNFGYQETSRIVSIDDWLCYICNPIPLCTFTQQLKQAELEREGSFDDRKGAGDTLLNSDQEAPFKKLKQGRHRKNIRKVLDDDELEEKQKELLAREKERQERLELWHKAAGFKNVLNPTKRKAVLTEVPSINMKLNKELINVARAENEAAVRIAPSLANSLKDHQIKGVRFMWENCIVSEQKVKEGAESFGCILAHSMGLGKTLQVVTFIHTVLHRNIGLRTALIVVPVNVLHNWKREFEIWQADVTNPVSVMLMEDFTRENMKRAEHLNKWQNDGGVMLIGYTAFRNLCLGNYVRDKATRDELCKALQNPGPDLLVCDEAHTIKNTKADITQVLKQVKTRRRIALTGSPLQNNLMEYYCMVDFVREGFLGSPQVFKNRFQNPIENGQHADSTARDVRLMKQRAHVLHNELKGFVQRMNTSVLKDELPPKCVYVISVRLSPLQRQLYKHYLQVHGFLQVIGEVMENKSQRKCLFQAYHALSKVWNHPDLLLLAEEEKRRQDDYMDDFIVDSDEEKLSDGDIGPDGISKGKAKVLSSQRSLKKKGSSELAELEKPLWWKDILKDDFAREEVEASGKMVLLLRLLTMSSHKGDKALVFSQSLGTLGMIEKFLERIVLLQGSGAYWQRDKQWYRLDGSTPAAARMQMCERFNDPSNTSVKCVLISTKAGSLGINLPAANRVIIFDGSWNPTHDLQALFRAWRLGQKKPVFAYRLLAHGTMEEKIYSRQVAKEGVAARVLDEQQVGRHFAGDDLEFLFRLEEDGDDFVSEESERTRIIPAGAPLDQGSSISPAGASVATIPLIATSKSKLLSFTLPIDAPPRDDLMGALLIDYRPCWVVSYHEHEPLLEHREEENLTSEEQKAALESYKMVEAGQIQNLSTTVIKTSTVVIQDTEQLPAGTGSSFVQPGIYTSTVVTKKSVQPPAGTSSSSVQLPGATGSVQPGAYTGTMATKNVQPPLVGSSSVLPQRTCNTKDHAAILHEKKVNVRSKIICATCMLDISWENLIGEPHVG